MNQRSLLALVVFAVVTAATAQETTPLTTTVQKFSYAIGLNIARNLRQQGIEKVDADALALAIQDALEGNEPRLTMPQMQAAVEAYREELMRERTEQAAKNEAEGAQFLAMNRDAEGVVELDSGVQYRVMKVGDGERPTETDTVVVHYRGRLLDGTEFDSSFGRGEPAELGLAQVIPGWREALQRMPVGSRWQVWIPSGLAYGSRGAGATIGPNATLYFEIELIAIKDVP